MGYHAGHKLVHWETTVPFGLRIGSGHVVIGVGALVVAALFYRAKLKRNAAKAAMTIAASRDAAWNENRLKQDVAEALLKIQAAWSQGNMAKLNGMLERALYREWEMRKAEAGLDGSRQVVSDVTVHEVEIMNAKDFLENSKDEFTARISFNATEAIYRNAEAVSVENGHFVEFWKMGRVGDGWKVREISRDGILARMSLALEPSIRETEPEKEKGGANG